MKSARTYRRHLSLPEQLLWRLLRQHRRDIRFRRQHPIGPYVADIYCPAAKLVVEIDGSYHDHSQPADQRRDAYLREVGLCVLRIPASDVLADPVSIAEALLRLCDRRAGPSTTQLRLAVPHPMLRNGEVPPASAYGPLQTLDQPLRLFKWK